MQEPQSPSRRSPHCKKCGQPRKGHPRTGCPSWNRTDSAGGGEQRATPATPTRRVDDRPDSKRRKRTSGQPTPPQLTHHTTAATEPIQPTFQSLLLDDEKDSLMHKIERWRKAVPSDPGELEPSSPRVKYEVAEETVTSHSRQPRPLGRTMSMEERCNFLERLKQNTKHTAQVFIMDKNDAWGALGEAHRQGFHGDVHAPAQGDAFLVLGMDREAVDALLETVRSGRGSPMKNCVAGAVVGAAAVWAGLAYS